MSFIPTLQTDRLNLRALNEQDVDRLFEIFGQPDVLRYFPNPSPPLQDKVAQLIANLIIRKVNQARPAISSFLCKVSDNEQVG